MKGPKFKDSGCAIDLQLLDIQMIAQMFVFVSSCLPW